jgi:hypothetical protein
MNTFLFDNSVVTDPQFQIVKQVIDSLWESGIIQRGAGYCLGMSDIMQKMLEARGVKSDIVECKLLVLKKNPPGIHLIGQDKIFTDGNVDSGKTKIDTHVVLITKTKIPMLIDTSIGHISPNIPYVCGAVNGKNHTLAEYNIDDSEWVYLKKPVEVLPELHQKSLLERIRTDFEVAHTLKLMKYIVIGLIGMSVINFTLNITTVVLKILYP